MYVHRPATSKLISIMSNVINVLRWCDHWLIKNKLKEENVF